MPGSINQNTYTKALPNFRNLGVLLRILVIVSVMSVGAALVKGGSLAEAWQQLARYFPRLAAGAKFPLRLDQVSVFTLEGNERSAACWHWRVMPLG